MMLYHNQVEQNLLSDETLQSTSLDDRPGGSDASAEQLSGQNLWLKERH